ncbi:MAG: 23S rRNA (uracil(1939)-C(5))-methyltransferase RlmD [Bilophila wadsworthia]
MAKPFVNPFVSGQFLELRVDALVSDGRGLGRHDGVVVLVEDALPGQLVRARVAAVRKSLAEAALVEVLERSPTSRSRRAPMPDGAVDVRGNRWPMAASSHGKSASCTTRWSGWARWRVRPCAYPALPSEWGYRNKMEFAFGVSGDGGKALGLRERGSRNIVEVTGCLLQTPLTMRVLEAVRMLSNGAFHDLDGRFLVVREPNAGGCFVELIVGAGGSLEAGERFAEALRAETPEVTGFALSERLAPSDVAYGERALYADGRLEERIGDVRLQMGHNAFFQVNTPAAELLYAEAARFAALEELPDPVLWDVYGGVGSIGLYMGRNARVVGIEEMPGAVRYARGNAKALGRKAYKVEQGDAKSVLGRLVKLGPKPDVVVVDPPRAGIDAKVAQQLAEAAPLRLIYVSCNPATLARDVARLAPAFRLKAARPVDLFPQTPHVETVALLERA